MATEKRSTYHRTVVLARKFPTAPSRLYAPLADVAERARLLSVSDAFHMDIVDADVCVGGHCSFRFGRKGDLRFHGLTTFHDIVPDQRIISTDVVSLGSKRLSVSACAFELKPVDGHTELKVTAQIIWLDGGDMIDGAEIPFTTLFDSLLTHHARRSGSAFVSGLLR